MPALRDTLVAHGFSDVRTHLQSGNVVLGAKQRSERAVTAAVAAAIAEEHGIDCPVLARTPAQLAEVIATCPFAGRVAATDAKALHVTFLDAPPARDAFTDVDPAWHAPDELTVAGREVYLLCPGGYGRTKLTPAFLERRTGRVATDRNWNTVLALAELARGTSVGTELRGAGRG
jgi:uncharacterized protein (DUF1697 family)